MDKTELMKYETYKDPYQVEKDYLQDLMLHTIYSKSESQMVFKGGTALSKFYYSGRLSEDLDFTLRNSDTTPLDYIKRLLGDVMKDMDYPTSYNEEPSENRFKTISANLAIEGPRYDLGRKSTMQHIRFEINTTSSTIFPPVNLSRQPKYRDADLYLAPVMDTRDILAEKFRAMMSRTRRHRERDLYDIHFLLGKGVMPNHAGILKKLEEAGMQFSKVTLIEAIGAIEPDWMDLVPFVSHKLEDYGSVRNTVIEALKKHNIL